MSVDLSKLLGILLTAKSKLQSNDPQLYQVISSLITNLQQLLNNQGQSDLVAAVTNLQKVIQALELLTFLTSGNESATLPNSRQLKAGTNITLDSSVLNELTINSTGGGGGGSTGSGPVFLSTREETHNLLNIPPPNPLEKTMGFVITGGSSSPVTGAQDFINRPASGGVFTKWSIFGFPSGSAVVDIKKSTYSAFSFSSICASDKPTLTSAQKNEGNCSGWTTGFDRGDLFQPTLDSISTCTAVMVILWYLAR